MVISLSRIAIDTAANNRSGIILKLLFALGFLLTSTLLHANDTFRPELLQQLDKFLESLDSRHSDKRDTQTLFVTQSLSVTQCDKYPYHGKGHGVDRLINHLSEGIQQGISCLVGKSSAGRLHEFHENKAGELLAILNSDQPKSLQCVSDELFAYAMAVSPHQQVSSIELKKKIRNSPQLTIFLDTFRIGGLLSKRFDEKTYQEFFNLSENQITEHLTSQPLRMKGLHRYQNLPALLFHETVHWLGATHTNQGPDLTFLYETCCFGGSDFVTSDALNTEFKAAACNILKDDELWSADPEQQKKIWKDKGYRKLKTTMRQFY